MMWNWTPPSRRRVTLAPTPSNSSDRRWPTIIAVGLFVVVVVNALFAYLAIHGGDPIVSSYNTEAR